MIRWGIIGTGKIAKRFIASLAHSQAGKLVAIASRKEETRKQYSEYKIYADYESLLQDDEIDAVYIGLPHAMHAEWSIKALQHHKAVLCEKPAVLTKLEMLDVIACANENNAFYMEAMKTKFTPAFRLLQRELFELGDIKHIDVNFCSNISTSDQLEPTSYLFDASQGGALNDVSAYPIAFVLALKKQLPTAIEVQREVRDNIDYNTQALLKFEDGCRADLEVSICKERVREALIICAKGKVKVPVFNRCTDFEIETESGIQQFHRDLAVDDFFDQIEEVHRCLALNRIESRIHSWQDSLDEIEVMERIRNS